MKEAQKYRAALGLTQEEAAQLLQVPKSLIGMFEIGQRDLPTKTKLQLITLYNLVQEKQESVITFKESELPISVLQHEFLENEYQLQFLERKLKQYKNKLEKSIKQLQLVAVLETQTNTDAKTSQDFTAVLKRKAERGIQKHGLQEQTRLELKIKGHQFFQKELERELKKHQNA
jgi:transcriptional regulator with XRE-family HTH domain